MTSKELLFSVRGRSLKKANGHTPETLMFEGSLNSWIVLVWHEMAANRGCELGALRRTVFATLFSDLNFC